MTATQTPETQAIQVALADPFDPKEVKFKPQMVKNNRALAMGYIDARLVQERLDDVLGVENWQDAYEFLPDGSVVCRLRLKLGGRWIAKTDVGSPSEQPDAGDRVKAAVSDALKRAAVKFGIGRYLYRLPSQWVDYDPVKKQLTQLPQLPFWALPAKQRPGAKPAAPAQQQQPAKPAAAQQAKPPQQQPANPPTDKERYDALSAARAAVNWSWGQCMVWLNAAYPADPVRYAEKTRFTEIEPARVDHLVRLLTALAAKAA